MTRARLPLVAVAAAAGLAAAAAAGCLVRRARSAPPPLPQPPPGEIWLTGRQVREAQIALAEFARRPLGTELVTSGRVAFDDLRVAHVFSPVTGRITRILAEPGARVKRGTPLAVIESPEVGNAFADLGKAGADLVAAEHDLARQKELYAAHAAAQRDLEVAEDNFGKARAEIDRARKKAALFRGGAADGVTQAYTLRAPIDGRVVARNLSPGVEVQGQYGGGTAPELFTVGELDRVWVMAEVFEMDIGKLRVGAPAAIRVVAYPERAFEGRIDWISETLDPATRTARVRCAVDNPGGLLKPEMYATVSLGVAGERVPAIARTAVVRLADQAIVFVYAGARPDGGARFQRRPVAVDDDDGGEFLPVQQGLALGDRVVTSGAVLLSGMP
ncbi:MAG TPA: efflux RND transporter periplasmic adaptor subunit [Polyangia bacterium]|nr:efflux RND transporter periplasmic adaptor subunit [Polyangia bacterium]